MSRFVSDGSKNPGDGGRNPPERKIKRFFYNIWVKITQNIHNDSRRIEGIRKF